MTTKERIAEIRRRQQYNAGMQVHDDIAWLISQLEAARREMWLAAAKMADDMDLGIHRHSSSPPGAAKGSPTISRDAMRIDDRNGVKSPQRSGSIPGVGSRFASGLRQARRPVDQSRAFVLIGLDSTSLTAEGYREAGRWRFGSP